jgi:hypothetical protein
LQNNNLDSIVIVDFKEGASLAIFFGGGTKSKRVPNAWVPYWCTGCDQISAFELIENYKYGQVYGIRLAKFSSKFFLVCYKCTRTYQLETKEQFLTAKAIHQKMLLEGLEGIDLNKWTIEVARWVMKNSDLAKALEKIQKESGDEKREIE